MNWEGIIFKENSNDHFFHSCHVVFSSNNRKQRDSRGPDDLSDKHISANEQSKFPTNSIRLHVIANSNSCGRPRFKICVRDKIISQLG